MPRWNTLLLFFTGFTCTATGQVGADSTQGRWSLGLSMGAGMSYRALSTTASDATNEAIIKSRDDREQPALALAMRAGVGYRLNKHWGLEAGVGYLQFGWQYTVDFSDLTFGDMIDPRRGFIYSTDDPAIPAHATFTDRFHYLEFPVGVTFQTGNGRWNSVTALGVSPAILLDAKDVFESKYFDCREEKEVRDVTDAFNTFNVFPYISTGIAFRACDRWELRLQPAVQYGVLRIIDTPITAHLFMGTVNLGVRFSL